MEGSDERSTEEILAAFRSRKAATRSPSPDVAPAPASVSTSASTSTSTSAPAAVSLPAAPKADPPLTPPRQAPPLVSRPMHDAPPEPAVQLQAPTASGDLAVAAPSSSASSLPAPRPAVQGASSLAVSSPALRLTDRLLADRFVAARGSLPGVLASLVVAGLGAVVAFASELPRLSAYPFLWPAGLGLLAIGLLGTLLFSFLPRSRRRIGVRFAGTQRQEWERLQAESRRAQAAATAGTVLAAAGTVAAAALRFLSLAPPLHLAWAAAGLLALIGLGVLAVATARRRLLQRLYVQTLVLSRLEQTGLGPAGERDARVAPVLRSLDQLLGALPESAVRRFLASDEATAYLELMDDLEGRRGG